MSESTTISGFLADTLYSIAVTYTAFKYAYILKSTSESTVRSEFPRESSHLSTITPILAEAHQSMYNLSEQQSTYLWTVIG